MKRTSYESIDILLDSLLLKIQGVLDKKLVGFYLYGSLVWGDFDYDISDIDLLAALSADIDVTELIGLQKMHRDFAKEHAEWENRIEVQYFSTEGLKKFRLEPSDMAVISPGEPLHMVQAGKEWLTNWYFVQEYGITFFGLSPNTFIPPISKEEFIYGVKEHALQWREYVKNTISSRPYQGYAILTMCRALYTLRNKEQVSKIKAVLWAKEQFPDYAWLIENALKWREDYKNDSINHEATYSITVEFINYGIDIIDKIDVKIL
jgi:predicted nucleotidyltransferase